MSQSWTYQASWDLHWCYLHWFSFKRYKSITAMMVIQINSLSLVSFTMQTLLPCDNEFANRQFNSIIPRSEMIHSYLGAIYFIWDWTQSWMLNRCPNTVASNTYRKLYRWSSQTKLTSCPSCSLSANSPLHFDSHIRQPLLHVILENLLRSPLSSAWTLQTDSGKIPWSHWCLR